MYQHKLSRVSLAANNLGLIAAVAFSTAGIPSAFAQNNDNGGQWSLGIGAVAIDKPYREFDREVKPLPIVSYENKWVSASIPTFDVKLYSTESLSFRLRAHWAGDGYETEDSPALAGMDEREASIWAGGAVIWKTEFANISGEVLADAMGNSKGTRAKLQIDRRFAAGKFGFTPRLATEWVDDKYVDYYYGVRTSEVVIDRVFYEGKASTNVQFGLRTDYTPSRHHMVFLDLGATRFGSTIKDSPLVDEANQTSLALGYVYRF